MSLVFSMSDSGRSGNDSNVTAADSNNDNNNNKIAGAT